MTALDLTHADDRGIGAVSFEQLVRGEIKKRIVRSAISARTAIRVGPSGNHDRGGGFDTGHLDHGGDISERKLAGEPWQEASCA